MAKTGLQPFRPVIDGKILPDSADSVYESGQASRVDLLVGCNSHEGVLFTIGPMPLKKFKTLDDAKALVRRFVQEAFYDRVSDLDGFAGEVIQEYLLSRGEEPDFEQVRRGMVELVGDVWFGVPTVSAADAHCGEAFPCAATAQLPCSCVRQGVFVEVVFCFVTDSFGHGRDMT